MMRKRLLSFVFFLLLILFHHSLYGEQPLQGTLTVSAESYIVTMTINGTPLAKLRGGQDDTVRLYSENAVPSEPDGAQPNAVFCLRDKDNKIIVRYEKIIETGASLKITLHIDGISNPVISFQSDKLRGIFEEKFHVNTEIKRKAEQKAPAVKKSTQAVKRGKNYKTWLISELRVYKANEIPPGYVKKTIQELQSYLIEEPFLTEKDVSSVEFNKNRQYLLFRMTEKGSAICYKTTKEWQKKRTAIFINNKLFSNPVLVKTIRGVFIIKLTDDEETFIRTYQNS
ncbi:MAG: hypothetical protein JW774_06795 [Candidatus Aureabacteria bacterium]|nr:hypothetical protein [Candidatus Auribacterota bacterium]